MPPPDNSRPRRRANSGERLLRVAQRYLDDPDVDAVAAPIEAGENVHLKKYPFSFRANISEENNELRVVIGSLVSPRLVYGIPGLFQIDLLERQSPHFDATLPKAAAGVLKGALARMDANPNIQTLRVIAPEIVNKQLAAQLRDLGFGPLTSPISGSGSPTRVLGPR
jgi:hypothetical protein